MKKNYKELTIGESIINSLEDAIKHEKGKKVKGVKTHTLTVAPLPDYKGKEIKNRDILLVIAQSHITGLSNNSFFQNKTSHLRRFNISARKVSAIAFS